MKKILFSLGLLSLSLFSISCQKEQAAPEPAVPTAASVDAKIKLEGFYGAFLTGSQQVPVVATRALGAAYFKLSADSTRLDYEVFVARLSTLRLAHLHLGAVGVSGPVVANLYTPATGPVLINPQGRVLRGTITAANLTGPLQGKPVADLLAALDANNIYLNVHSVQYPAGEIRGQVKSSATL